jgi:hypothetical protein
MKYFIALFILTSMSVVCQSQTNNIKAEIKYLCTIVNGSESAAKEYLFANPEQVQTDSKNNIYINEYHGTEIRKYSSEGRYLAAFGRPGDGPGEFRCIISNDLKYDKLLVYDIAGKITEYSSKKKFLSKYIMDNLPQQLWQYPGSRILAKEFEDDTSIKNIFHIYADKMKKRITEFGHPSIFFDLNSPVYLHERSQLNVLVLDNGCVFTTKYYYDGNLYKFNPNLAWNVQKFRRPGYDYKPYRVISPLVKGANYVNIWFFQDRKTNKQIGIQPGAISIGLLLYENKYILNFICQNMKHYLPEKDITEFGVEVFDKNGNYLGYCKLENDNITDKGIMAKAACIDKDDCLYMIGYDSISPKSKVEVLKVKKYKLRITMD